MVRFAIMENNLGDRERAQTLFEQILTSYPKRVDVWSSYIDCLVKYEDIDIARYGKHEYLSRDTLDTTTLIFVYFSGGCWNGRSFRRCRRER